MTSTAHTATSPVGAHLVGSVPLANADEVITTAAAQLGDHLRRIPDGETGVRTIWIVWQEQVFADNPDLEPVASDNEQYAAHTRYRVRAGATAASVDFRSLGYAEHALASYQRFAALKSRGQIRPDVRFQISLPTPLAPINQFAALDERAALEPRYEAAMDREIARIADEIPAGEASIQIDIAFEMGMLEGIQHPLFEAWFPESSPGRRTGLRASVHRFPLTSARVPPLLRRFRARALPATRRRRPARADGQRDCGSRQPSDRVRASPSPPRARRCRLHGAPGRPPPPSRNRGVPRLDPPH